MTPSEEDMTDLDRLRLAVPLRDKAPESMSEASLDLVLDYLAMEEEEKQKAERAKAEDLRPAKRLKPVSKARFLANARKPDGTAGEQHFAPKNRLGKPGAAGELMSRPDGTTGPRWT